MRNARLEETQAGIKIAGRNINNLRYADDTTLMAESEEELKSLLMKVKVAASQEKTHVWNWRSKRYLAPLIRPTKCPDIPVSLKRNTEVFPHHFL